jgi:hypothetical protein
MYGGTGLLMSKQASSQSSQSVRPFAGRIMCARQGGEE